MENICNSSFEKSILDEIIEECAADFAKENGKDPYEENVVIVNNFLREVSRFEISDLIINKLIAKGYQIIERD